MVSLGTNGPVAITFDLFSSHSRVARVYLNYFTVPVSAATNPKFLLEICGSHFLPDTV